MKALTVISTVMLPITFIAGLYGMNFKFMPELEERWGYPAVLCVMMVVVLGALLWFWHKGWIGSKELDVPDEEDAG